MIWTIAMAIVLIIVIAFVIKSLIFKADIVNHFKKNNVIVFGKKGKGKDLLFQKVINERKEHYYSNIPYGGKCELLSVKDISVAPNTYQTLIAQEYYKVDIPFKERSDIYLSDCGIYLPSQMDSQLHKLYPSFPIYYALSRHLALNNVHCNTQALGRVWKALREQADYYVRCEGVIKLPFVLIIKCTTYDKYESAERGLLPLSRLMFNQINKADIEKYRSENGEIHQGYIFVWKKEIRYNTRIFKTFLSK